MIQDRNIKLKHVLVLISVAVLTSSLLTAQYVMSQSSTVTIERGSFQTPVAYTIFLDGSVFKARNQWGQIEFSGSDVAAIINQAITAAKDGSAIVIQPSDSLFILNNYININKNINFYLYASLKLRDNFPDPQGIHISADDATIYIYRFDGNKANNPSEIQGVVVAGAQNTKIFIHTLNFGYADVVLYAPSNDWNKNVELSGLFENSGGVGLNSVIYLNLYNDNIVISGFVKNVSGASGQALYNNALGIVTLKDFKVQNSTSTNAVLDTRANTRLFIENVEVNNTGSDGLVVHQGAIVQANNLHIKGVGILEYGIENLGTFLGSNIYIENGNRNFMSRGGSDYVSISNFYFENPNVWSVIINTDSAGNHSFTNGKIVAPYGIRDDAPSGSKSRFTNVDLTEVTETKVYGSPILVGIVGFVTENHGSTPLGSQSRDWISHGLAGTPQTIQLTVEATVPIITSVKEKNSTHFQIGIWFVNGTEVYGADKTSYNVFWYAKYRP